MFCGIIRQQEMMQKNKRCRLGTYWNIWLVLDNSICKKGCRKFLDNHFMVNGFADILEDTPNIIQWDILQDSNFVWWD